MWRWRGKSDCNMPSAAEVMAASRANLRVCRVDGVVVGVRDGVARAWHERLQRAERSGSGGCVPCVGVCSRVSRLHSLQKCVVLKWSASKQGGCVR